MSGSKTVRTEKSIETSVQKWSTKAGWIGRKYKTPSRRAAPDRIFFRDGVTIFIEFKRTGEKPTDAQWDELKLYREAGFHADWCDDVEIGKGILRGDVAIPVPGDRSHPMERVSEQDRSKFKAAAERVLGVDGGSGREETQRRRRTVSRDLPEWGFD